MLGRTFRTFIAGLVFALMLSSNSQAGPICDAVGKGWDKIAAHIVKVHKAAGSLVPKGKLIKSLKEKVGAGSKHGAAGGCRHCK